MTRSWQNLLQEGHLRSVRHPVELARWVVYKTRRGPRARAAQALFEKLVLDWDQKAFIERFRPYWDPFPTKRPAKYLDLQTAVSDAADLYLSLGIFDGGRARRVLDIGCGPGYFLAICRAQGHEVVGIDIADQPLYNELIEFLGIPRRVHRVSPGTPLPEDAGTFDVITAFGVVFNLDSTSAQNSWTGQDWMLALERFIGALAPGGSLVIGFNADSRTGQLYPTDLRSLIGARAGIRSRFLGEFLFITRD